MKGIPKMSDKTPFSYTHEYNPTYRMLYIEIIGFSRAIDQIAMTDVIHNTYQDIPKPNRLVLNYNRSDTNIVELVNILTKLPNLYKQMQADQIVELLMINNTSSWARMAANLAIHPRYGGIALRVYDSYESVLEYIRKYPL